MNALTHLEVRQPQCPTEEADSPDALLSARKQATCQGYRTSHKRRKSENQKEKTSNISNS